MPDRATLAFCVTRMLKTTRPDANGKVETRVESFAFCIRPALIKAAILPPMRKHCHPERARKIYDDPSAALSTTTSAAIGKRHCQDEIGTPLCITVDYDTITDGTVTARSRHHAAVCVSSIRCASIEEKIGL